MIPRATKVKCSEFGDVIVKHMGNFSSAGQREPVMAGAYVL